MSVCGAGRPEHIIPQRVQSGDQTEERRERDRAAALADKSWTLPCLLCPKRFRETAATRLWSRVIGGAGCCPACSKSRLPHHRFSPNLPRGAGCNPDLPGLPGSRASQQVWGPYSGQWAWEEADRRLDDGQPERSKVEVISSLRPWREVRGQGTSHQGQAWLETVLAGVSGTG